MKAVNLVNEIGKPTERTGICACFSNIRAMCCDNNAHDQKYYYDRLVDDYNARHRESLFSKFNDSMRSSRLSATSLTSNSSKKYKKKDIHLDVDVNLNRNSMSSRGNSFKDIDVEVDKGLRDI